MSINESYFRVLPVLQAIPVNKVKAPQDMPITVYMQKAEVLYRCCRNDLPLLKAWGFKKEMMEDLPIRTRALMQAETLWSQSRKIKNEEMACWAIESKAGHQLRQTLLHKFRFAFRENHGLLMQVQELASGNSHEAMIAALNGLSLLGKANSGLLAAIHFDMELLAVAGGKVDGLMRLMANAQLQRRQLSSEKDLRDRAYTHLKEAVDYVRNYGKFVFRWQPQRLQAYFIYASRSAYSAATFKTAAGRRMTPSVRFFAKGQGTAFSPVCPQGQTSAIALIRGFP